MNETPNRPQYSEWTYCGRCGGIRPIAALKDGYCIDLEICDILKKAITQYKK